MKKYLKTTLGRKLLAFYLVLFAITFYLITTVGRDYISERVESESISNLRSVGITLLGSHINEQRYTKTTILSRNTKERIPRGNICRTDRSWSTIISETRSRRANILQRRRERESKMR